MRRRIKLANPTRLISVCAAAAVLIIAAIFLLGRSDPSADYWKSVAESRNAEIEPTGVNITSDKPDQSDVSADMMINFSGTAHFKVKGTTQMESIPFDGFEIKPSDAAFEVLNKSVMIPKTVEKDTKLEVKIIYFGKEMKTFTFNVKKSDSSGN